MVKENRDIIGDIATEWDPVTQGVVRNGLIPVSIRFNNAGKSFLNVVSESNYKEFLKSVIAHPNISIFVDGTASAQVETGIGHGLNILDVGFQQVVNLHGVDEFKDSDIRFMDNLQVTSIGTGNKLEFELMSTWMKLPGNGKLGMQVSSPLNFDLYYHPDDADASIEAKVGVVTINSLYLDQNGICNNTLTNHLTGQVYTFPEGTLYCIITARGSFELPDYELSLEQCGDHRKCPGKYCIYC